MAYLMTFVFNDITNARGGLNPPSECGLCKPLEGRLYVPGAEPTLPLHAGCKCYYVQTNVGDPSGADPNHIHQEYIDDIHDLNITELQAQVLELGAAIQDLVERVCVNTYA